MLRRNVRLEQDCLDPARFLRCHVGSGQDNDPRIRLLGADLRQQVPTGTIGQSQIQDHHVEALLGHACKRLTQGGCQFEIETISHHGFDDLMQIGIVFHMQHPGTSRPDPGYLLFEHVQHAGFVDRFGQPVDPGKIAVDSQPPFFHFGRNHDNRQVHGFQLLARTLDDVETADVRQHQIQGHGSIA